MRILYGPISDDVAATLAALPHEIRGFSDCTQPLPDLLAAQGDWQPDVVVFHSPEYYLLPPNLADCPVPLVFIVGDWNLALSRILPTLRMADAIVTDRYGVEVLQRHGFANVHYWPAFTFDPAVHRPRPDEPILYDVSFIGSFNHAVHAERARWLARLAQLSDRYRIALLTNVTGDAYGQVLSQSRLVFNYSVRREMNMRAYETAAAGRVLLMEADNREVRDFLPEGEACLLYDETNLEALIEGILADPERQQRLGAAARSRIARETFLDHWGRLADMLATMAFSPPAARPWHGLDEARQWFALSRQALQTVTPMSTHTAWRLAEQALERAPGDPQVQLNHAVMVAIVYKHAVSADDGAQLLRKSVALFRNLLEAHPAYAQAWFAYGNLLSDAGAPEAAEQAWFQALAAMDGASPFSLGDALYPAQYDRFRVLWERAAASNDDAVGKACLKGILAERLAQAGLSTRPAVVKQILDDVLLVQPDNADLWRLLGNACLLLDDERVREAWQRSLTLLPFQFELRQQLATLLINLGHWVEAHTLLDETRRLLAAAPPYRETWAGIFAALAQSLQEAHRDWLLVVPEAGPDWLAVVEGFWRAFRPGQPVTLHLFVGPVPGEGERIIAVLEDALQRWGFSAEEVAEVSVSADPAEIPASVQEVVIFDDPVACRSWLWQQAALG